MISEYYELNVLLGRERLLVKVHNGEHDGWTVERHSNAEYELHVVLQGSCQVEVGEKCLHAAAGSALLIPPGQYHQPIAVSEHFERANISFELKSGALNTLLQSRAADGLLFPMNADGLQLTRRLRTELETDAPFQSDVVSAMYTLLLASVLRQLELYPEAGPRSVSPADWRTWGIDDFFEKHFADYGAENELASLLHLSRRQLARVLMEKYGMSFREKLMCTRMDRAGWLLRTTELKVGEIGSRVGYASEGAFFKAFSAYYKTTPLKYRETFQMSQKTANYGKNGD